MAIKKSKTNTTFFQDIPKPNGNEKVLNRLKTRARLRETRALLLEESREIRKKIYNYSLDIEEIDTEIDKMIKE